MSGTDHVTGVPMLCFITVSARVPHCRPHSWCVRVQASFLLDCAKSGRSPSSFLQRTKEPHGLPATGKFF